MTRDELSTYTILIQKAAWLSDKLKAMRGGIDNPRVPRLTGMPGARQTRPGSAQEHAVDVYMDIAPEYEAELRETRERILRIEKAVARLPEKEQMVTRLHCFDKHGYKYISGVMDLAISTITAIQINAYKLLEEEDAQEEKD